MTSAEWRVTSDRQSHGGWRLLKVVYFATICLPPPLMIILYPAIFLGYVRIPGESLTYYTFYFWLGLLILLIDLWISGRKPDTKILWTALLIIFGIATLPIYWFRFVLRDYRQADQTPANALEDRHIS